MNPRMTPNRTEDSLANRDPISGAPGAHPVGTGAGAAAGGIAGAAAGAAVGGPVGAVVGAAVGAVAGGLGGKAAAEAIDPSLEDAHWRQAYLDEPYYFAGRDYEYYRRGYDTGVRGRQQYGAREFDDVEADLRDQYNRDRPEAAAPWDDDGRSAARAAWDRLDRAGATAGVIGMN